MADKFSKRPGIFDEDTSGFAFREVFTPLREGPLPRAKPRPSGKGGPSLGFIPLPPPGGTKSVWSAADAAANGMTLSNGGLTVTPTAAGWQTVRTTTSKTSGKLYIEFLANTATAAYQQLMGLASAGFVVTSYLGSSVYSGGIFPDSTSQVSSGFTSNYNIPQFAVANDVWALAVDFAGNVWVAQNNVWLGGSNPATGSSPILSFVPATVGALFAGISLHSAGDLWTLQPTAASQKYLPPPGFQAWDGGPVTPPAVTGHRYWRLNISTVQATGYAAMAEVQFRTTAGVPLLFSGGTVSASSEDTTDGPYQATQAADNNPATFWASNTPVPQWWGYDYGAGNAKAIVEITIQARPDGTYVQAPVVFTPQWSDDDTNWTSMAQITSATWTAAGQIQTFAVSAASTASIWSASDAAALGFTLTNGGLTFTGGVGTYDTMRTSVAKSSGKLYVEFLINSSSGQGYEYLGLASSGFSISGPLGSSNYSGGCQWTANSVSTGFTGYYGSSFQPKTNDVFGLAVDFGAGSVWIAKNGVWDNSSNPATASLPILSFVPATVGALYATISVYPAGTYTLQSTAASQKYAPPAGFTPWDGGPVTPPPSSVWSASDAAANGMTLSNGGLTVTNGGNNSGWSSIRSTISHASGKAYIEILISASNGNGLSGIGLASASFVSTGAELGSSNYSCGIIHGGNSVSAGFVSNYITNEQPQLNDVWALAVDFTAGSVWVAQNNVWLNSSNPATGSLPVISFTPATVEPLFAALSTVFAGEGRTLQPTAASQKYAPPSGFSAWDGGVAPPPTSVWSAADATANGMTLSNGGLTVTAANTSVWQSVRGTVSKTTGKLYLEFLYTGTGLLRSTAFKMQGLASSSFVPTANLGTTNYSVGIWSSGPPVVSSGFTGNYTSSLATDPATNDVFALAVDFSAGKIWFSLNNVWSDGSSPATGTSPIASFVPATVGALFPAMSLYDLGVWTLQATAASQKYAPPSGFTPWG